MRIALVLATLLAPPVDGPVAGAPPPTVWARAGARPWRMCRDGERQAAIARRATTSARGGAPSEELLWSRRARKCPHAPLTLVEAAQREVVQAGSLLRAVETWGTDEPEQLEEVATELHDRLSRAHAWVQAAIDESERRGERAPREAHYYRAYTLTGLGRVEDARAALQQTVARGDVESWRADRMAALVEIMAGDLSLALGLAEHAVRVIDATTNDGLISRYIRAFVLDRAGASAFARLELRSLRSEPDSLAARDAVESVLPIHERLFLRALDATANGEDTHALRLWDLYLMRPEPQAPERVLAERHRAELAPPGPVIRKP